MARGKYDHKRRKIEYDIDNNGCHICTSHSLGTHGYPQMQKNRIGYNMHRYIYEELNGKQPNDVVIRHTCDNRKCINPEHLIPGSKKENSEDMVERNRSSVGIKNGLSKLTDKEVIEIRNSALSTYKLANIYNVSRINIGLIKQGKTWKHITQTQE